MASVRYFETKELFKETFNLIESSIEQYRQFLTFASKHYKYSFQDIILIYSQRPNATAVTDMLKWNNVFNRRIARGIRSIAVFDSNSNTGLKYLFDVTDTHGSKPPLHWQMKLKHEKSIMEVFLKSISNKVASNLDTENLSSIIDMKAALDCQKYLDDIMPDTEASSLADMEASQIESRFMSTVMDSVGYIIRERTGIKTAGDTDGDKTLNGLKGFDTLALRSRVHDAINEITKDALIIIEQSVKKQEKQALLAERSEEDEYDLYRKKWNEHTKSTDFEQLQTDESTRQIREIGTGLSQGEKAIQSDGAGDGRQAGKSVLYGRRGSERDGTLTDGNDAEIGASKESAGHTKNSQTQKNDTDASRGSSLKRANIYSSLESGGKLGVEVNSAPFLVQKTILKDFDNKNGGSEDIEKILLHGSGVVGGKQRIVDFFAEIHSMGEKANFLKNEYGIGGRTFHFESGVSGYANHDAKGMNISSYGIGSLPKKLIWIKVTNGIDALITNGKYFEKQYESEIDLAPQKCTS